MKTRSDFANDDFDDVVNGWGEVASVLGRSVRTTQCWAKAGQISLNHKYCYAIFIINTMANCLTHLDNMLYLDAGGESLQRVSCRKALHHKAGARKFIRPAMPQNGPWPQYIFVDSLQT